MNMDETSKGRGQRHYVPPGRGSPNICKFFQSGTCNYGSKCKFIHPGIPTSGSTNPSNGSPNTNSRQFGSNQRRESGQGSNGIKTSFRKGKLSSKVCKYWLQGDCRKGDACVYQHTHSSASDVELMSELKGHEKGIRALAVPENSTQLYSGSQDETIRIWDCVTGQSMFVENVGGDVGSLLSTSGWLFVGLSGQVKAYNMTAGGAQSSLAGPRGQVHVLAQFGDFLFGGCQNGSILSWRYEAATSSFEPFTSLVGHTGAVLALQLHAGRLYSGSMDTTIRVWDLSTGCCSQMAAGHVDIVMGLYCWESYLISCSLDGTIRAWSINPADGLIQLIFTHPEGFDSSQATEQDGVLAISGGIDAKGKPILLAAYTDNSVRIYDLPMFGDRGSLFSGAEVRSLLMKPMAQQPVIFSGDSAGGLKVWRFL